MDILNQKKAILIIGPMGSGKGTQSVLLSQKFGFFHFMTSKIGQEYIKEHHDKETLKQMKLYKSGALWEPLWTLKMVKEKTKEILFDHKGIIYDGSPRTLYEAENFYPFLSKLIGKENIQIIEIKINDDKIKQRLEKRLVCDKNSSHVFIHSDDLKEGYNCPNYDQGVLKKRDLDSPHILKVRIEEYKNRTSPVLNFLKSKHKVIEINGEQMIEEVLEEILNKLSPTCRDINN